MASNQTQASFTTIAGPALGIGPDQIKLLVGEDYYAGNVQFTISVNGVQVGGVQTATAIQANGQDQSFTVNGTWTGNPTVSVNFLNDDWDGSTGNGNDRNLYVDGISYNGVVASSTVRSVLWNGPTYYSTQPVERTSDFLGSIGVTTHLLYADTSYKNEALVLSSLAYLGIDHVRDGGSMLDPNAIKSFETAAASGIKFDFTSSTDGGVATEIARLRTLVTADPGSVISVEGINEATASFSYGGLTGQAAALKFQTDLFTAIKADPLLSTIPVLNYTLLSQDPADYTAFGNVSSTATDGNIHLYPYGGLTTETSTLLPRELEGTPNSKGFVITETGYDTLSNGADVSAKYLLDGVLDATQAGASMTYIYELLDDSVDPANNNVEDHFGLFNADGTPKPAAVGFHNLTSILADTGANASTFQAGSLSYSVSNLPDTGHSLLLAKSDGSFDLAIWAEPQLRPNSNSPATVAAPLENVTVNLDQTAASVAVYDTLVGTTPIKVYTNVSSVTVGVTDHPLILAIVPQAAAVTTANSTSATTTPTATNTPQPAGLIVNVSEDAYNGDAQFTVTIDGQQVGNVYTATASHAAGQSQAITLASALTGGPHQIGVTFINDAYGGSSSTDRNLYVDGASYNGTAVAGATAGLYGNSTDTFVATTAPATVATSTTASTPTGTPTTPGTGLVVDVAEDAFQGDAQFTVTLDGQQIGGVYTATASHAAGQSQAISLASVLGGGFHRVGISFINDAYGGTSSLDRNLYVTGATYNGTNIAGAAQALYGDATDTFGVTTGTPITSSATLNVAEDAWQGDAQFTVAIDGKQYGGTYTATASHAAGQGQAVTIAGIPENFTAHDIAVTFINDAYGGSSTTDRNLYVNSIQFDNQLVPGAAAGLYGNGTQHFTALAPSNYTG